MDLNLDIDHNETRSFEQTRRPDNSNRAICACPICKARFSSDEISGGYLDRKCPFCSSPISIDLYDELAKDILEKRRALRVQLETLSSEMRVANHALDMTKPREIYALTGLRERKANLSAKMRVFRSEILDLDHQLERIATDRYHISEWYLRTHIDLDHQSARAKLDIKPHYSAKGAWCFRCNNAVEAGFAAELYVADLLFKRASDPTSPLFKAQIFPNIYIPRERNSKKASLWVQIDCLMITRSCVFILEIKRHSRHIMIPNSSSYTSIYSSKKPNVPIEELSELRQLDKVQLRKLGLSNRESEALKQNEFHAESFKKLCPMFDLKSILKQIVYVKPSSFTSQIHGFVDGISVDYAYHDDPHFLEILEARCAEMPAVYTQQQIDDVAERIIAPNCDLDHQREALHKMISRSRRKKRKPNSKGRC